MIKDAATVMLVRDTAGGMEVLLLRRNLASNFVGGAYVFPGGAVDESDRAAEVALLCRGRSDAEASRLLGLHRGGLAYWVAAIRETFEEAGLLLAARADGTMLRLDEADVASRFAEHRAAVDDGRRSLAAVCASEGLALAVDSIHYFGHWITPGGLPRRYDTRFFVALAPEAQVPWHDERETIAHLWLRPAEALDRTEAGELDLILPTLRSLTAITRFDHASDLLDAAALGPSTVDDVGGMRIALPGDQGLR